MERHPRGNCDYPAVIQGADDTIHVPHCYSVAGGMSIKHAAFKEVWVRNGTAGRKSRVRKAAGRMVGQPGR